MRTGKMKVPFKVGDVVMLKEELGSKKNQFRGQYEVTHIRPRSKSFFVKDLESGRTYLRNQDKMKIHPDYRTPDLEVKSIRIKVDGRQVPMKGILKKPGSVSKTYKNVVFDASFHTARLIARQSILDWLKTKHIKK